MTDDRHTQFDAECRAAGLTLSGRDRELLFQEPSDHRARGGDPVHLSRPSAF